MTFYVNIGSGRSCLFLPASMHLVKCMQQHPALYHAIEEAQDCARDEYYTAGIIVLDQALTALFNVSKRGGRNKAAHERLKSKPSREDYELLLEELKNAAKKKQELELRKAQSRDHWYIAFRGQWRDLMTQLGLSVPTVRAAEYECDNAKE